ncbi:MAG: hypothetical protein SFV54_06170 [Bryobacteraceae bacterium]|nr:hypothetical protein [Bryobacteraceae bacterium]
MKLFERNDWWLVLAVVVCLLASAPREFDLRLPNLHNITMDRVHSLTLQTLEFRTTYR